jgi:hypothetical protein
MPEEPVVPLIDAEKAVKEGKARIFKQLAALSPQGADLAVRLSASDEPIEAKPGDMEALQEFNDWVQSCADQTGLKDRLRALGVPEGASTSIDIRKFLPEL